LHVKQFIKQKLKESMAKLNSLGIEISRPSDILIIMRGIPGAGKSTKVKTLVEFFKGGRVHSTDALIEESHDYNQFFSDMIASGSFANLSRMHSKNLQNAKKSMDEGISPVIIDNTHIRANEAKAYVEYALKLGYSDERIMIVDIGTGGLTAEQLANRNTHGVPLKKIEEMIKAYDSTGELTVKKIMESKDMYPNSNIFYSAVVLDEKSSSKLLSIFSKFIPKDWNKYAHHMTIAFGKSVPNKEDIGKKVELKVTKLGISDKAIAVQVEGYQSLNKIPHITLAVNPDGGKPVDSNNIENWVPIHNIDSIDGIYNEIFVNGIVTNIKKK
jgi:predicted kinase